MSVTLLSDVSAQVKKFWSDIFVPELMEMSVLPGLVSREYEGEIKQAGDTVKVSSFQRPVAQRKTVGSGHETFEVGKLQTDQIEITANEVITAGFKFDSLTRLQSQVGDPNSDIRRGILEAMLIEVNNYLYSLLAPATATGSVTDFNLTAMGGVRTQASLALWPESERYLLLGPQYYTDFMAVANFTSADYVGDDKPVVNGKVLGQRYGFWIAEDNSVGMRQVSPTSNAAGDTALAFHPSFMYFVTQLQPEFEISSLHALGQHGHVITAKMVCGAQLGIDGDVKHTTRYAT